MGGTERDLEKKTERTDPREKDRDKETSRKRQKGAPAGGSPELLAALAFSAGALLLGTVKGAAEAPRCEGAAWPAWELRSALPATAPKV